jgi:hypothetical protein
MSVVDDNHHSIIMAQFKSQDVNSRFQGGEAPEGLGTGKEQEIVIPTRRYCSVALAVAGSGVNMSIVVSTKPLYWSTSEHIQMPTFEKGIVLESVDFQSVHMNV